MAGRVLSNDSCMAPRAAVVVRLPAQQPRFMAGRNLEYFMPDDDTPSISGSDVQTMPARNSPEAHFLDSADE